jgi:hypothetical protein
MIRIRQVYETAQLCKCREGAAIDSTPRGYLKAGQRFRARRLCRLPEVRLHEVTHVQAYAYMTGPDIVRGHGVI